MGLKNIVINEIKEDVEDVNVGALDGIKGKHSTAEEKKKSTIEEGKEITTEETKIKRGYCLKLSTITKLNQLKVYHYPLGTSLEEIVDEAICKLYDLKKGE
jgi:hypothetical protein